MPKRDFSAVSTAALRKRARKYEIQHGGRPRGVVGMAAARRLLAGMMEKKVIDTAAASYAVDTTGSITLINGVAQGSDFTNRTGRKSKMVTVQVAGQLGPTGGTDNSTGCHAKVFVVFDTQPNGALPTMTDILTASTSDSFMNLNNRDRFKVVAQHDVALGPFDNTSTTAYSDSAISLVSIYKKIDVETIYDGTTAGIADVQTGSLLLVTIGNNAAAQGYVARLAVRVRFTDA